MKLKPHYDLTAVQHAVIDMKAAAFTKTAIDGGRAMGLTVAEMIETIQALRHEDFHKSMPTKQDHRIWQDVYHGWTPNGLVAYIKITERDRRPVIQFKEK